VITKGKETIIFQVCYDLNTKNYDREIKWCVEAMKKFNTKNSYLITFEQEKDIEIDGNIIKILPFYKF
jgi:hypothetical protein